MARKLPWERPASRVRPGPESHRRSFSPGLSGATRRRDGDGDGDGDSRQKRVRQLGSPPKSSPRTRPIKSRRSRTPSTSPPPAPPPESFMIEGIDNDDQYRMVEDELLAVAQTFTAHLHAAEYQRLKVRAKTQTTSALRSIARPVTGAPTERVRKRGEMDEVRDKQKRGIRKALQIGAAGDQKDAKMSGDEDEDEDEDEGSAPWTGTTLQSLMEGSPKKAKPALVSLAPFMSAGHAGNRVTRPLKTAATRDSSETEEEDDDDDLDGPPVPKKVQSVSTAPKLQPSLQTRTVSFAPKTKEIPPDPDKVGEDDGSDSLSDDIDGMGLLKRLRKRHEQQKAERERKQQRRAERAKSRDAGAKTQTLDIIPSFL